MTSGVGSRKFGLRGFYPTICEQPRQLPDCVHRCSLCPMQCTVL
jgi:hypothetical protein